jgi:integrase
VRDRAILATLFYHGIRREELCGLRIRNMQSRRDVVHLWIRGKRGKIRFVPVHGLPQRLIQESLAFAGHGADAAGRLFRPVTNKRTGELDRAPRVRLPQHRPEIRPGDWPQRRGERALRAFPARRRGRPMPCRTRPTSPRSWRLGHAPLRLAQGAPGGQPEFRVRYLLFNAMTLAISLA